jgi:hypothetical protein
MSLHDRQRIIDLLNAKLKAGQEPNISQDDINNIGFIYADDNEQPGTVTIITVTPATMPRHAKLKSTRASTLGWALRNTT